MTTIVECCVVIVVDEKAANTDGGGFTSAAWQTRVLNTLRVNDDSAASLSSNQITLPAGTYECWISAPAFDVSGHMIRLQNITGASTIITGTSEFASGASPLTQSRSFIYHKFTVAASQALEIQHRCEITSSGATGFGKASDLGVVETYTVAMFRKVD